MKRMIGLTVVLGSALVGGMVLNGMAAERDASLYIGTKTCAMCHKKAEGGNQFGIWQASPHAKAIESLGTPEAKAMGAKVGVADPQKSGKCLKCHSTAYNFTEELQVKAVGEAAAKVAVEDGVTCESCHGPGKNYKAKTVMADRAQSIAGGLIYPAAKSCTLCHNDQSPAWKADRYTTKDGKKVGFDPEQAYEKIKHPDPAVKK
ncbi:MAG: cytochrome c family protein [bacterium]